MSSVHSVFRPKEDWERIHEWLTRDTTPSPQAADESDDVLEGFVDRSRSALDVLRQKVASSEPDALLILGADRGTVFNHTHVPQICVHMGEQVWGSTAIPELGEDIVSNTRTFRCHAELGAALANHLVENEFDISHSQEFLPLAEPELGISAGFTYAASALTPGGSEIPLIPIYLNCHSRPALNGRRCYELGRAIGEFLQGISEKVAICASGGLSGDPGGPRAGWVDTPLDDWVLEQLTNRRSATLTRMFDLDSDSVRGNAAEIRTWIATGAAMESIGSGAQVVDYIPAHKASAGLAFAYWPGQS
jgi:protocatechuate 4,5-dioxygenase beta chain